MNEFIYLYFLASIIGIIFFIVSIILKLPKFLNVKLLLFGLIGLLTFRILEATTESPIIKIGLSLLLSVGVSLLVSKHLTEIILKTFENNGKKLKNIYILIGQYGIAEISISKNFGVMSIKTENEKRNVVCKSYREEIPKGERVLITDYSESDDLYIVDRYPI